MGVGVGDREPPVLDEAPRPPAHGLDLGRRQQVGQHPGQGVVEGREIVDDGAGELLAGELPDDGAQLGLAVEAQPVVDGPDGVVLTEDAVTALAVGVVGDDVEGADGPQALVMALVTWWLMRRSRLGFSFKVIGLNPDAGKTAGIDGASARAIVSGTRSQPSALDSS